MTRASSLKRRLIEAEIRQEVRQEVISERQGELLAGVIFRVLDSLELTPGQRTKALEVAAAEVRKVAEAEKQRP